MSSDAKDPENATRDWFMEGILVQARLADCSSPTPIGTFTVPDCDDFLQVIDCSGLKMVRFLLICFLTSIHKSASTSSQLCYLLQRMVLISCMSVKQSLYNRIQYKLILATKHSNILMSNKVNNWIVFCKDFFSIGERLHSHTAPSAARLQQIV